MKILIFTAAPRKTELSSPKLGNLSKVERFPKILKISSFSIETPAFLQKRQKKGVTNS